MKLDFQNRRTVMWNIIKKILTRQSSVTDGINEGTNNNNKGGMDSITMVPDVEKIVRDNERYRSLLDSLNSTMDDEVDMLSGSIPASQNMASFL